MNLPLMTGAEGSTLEADCLPKKSVKSGRDVVCPCRAVCLLHPYPSLCRYIPKAGSSLVRRGGTEGYCCPWWASLYKLPIRIRISYTTTTFSAFSAFLSLLVEAFPAQRGRLLPVEHCSLHPGPLAARITRLLLHELCSCS